MPKPLKKQLKSQTYKKKQHFTGYSRATQLNPRALNAIFRRSVKIHTTQACLSTFQQLQWLAPSTSNAILAIIVSFIDTLAKHQSSAVRTVM